MSTEGKNKIKEIKQRSHHEEHYTDSVKGSKGANDLGRTIWEIRGQLAVSQRSQKVNQEGWIKWTKHENWELREGVEKYCDSEESGMVKGRNKRHWDTSWHMFSTLETSGLGPVYHRHTL